MPPAIPAQSPALYGMNFLRNPYTVVRGADSQSRDGPSRQSESARPNRPDAVQALPRAVRAELRRATNP